MWQQITLMPILPHSPHLLRAKQAVYLCYWLEPQFSICLLLQDLPESHQSCPPPSPSLDMTATLRDSCMSLPGETRPSRWQCRFRHTSRLVHYCLQTTGQLWVIPMTHQGTMIMKDKQGRGCCPQELPSCRQSTAHRDLLMLTGRAAELQLVLQACLSSGILMVWGIPLIKPIILPFSLSNGPWLCSSCIKSLGLI